MKLNTELERKFMVRRMPKSYLAYDSKEITQWYICIDPPIRVRAENFEDCYLTIKIEQEAVIETRQGFRAKLEFEESIPRGFALHLEKVRKFNKVRKTRYLIGNLELDVFYEKLSGLVMLEFEKKSKDNVFVMPPGFITEEVTFDPRFENHNLAQLGSIKEDWRCEIVQEI